MAGSEIILHNYPQSPVAEKVRLVLGLKGLTWSSVEIPRLPPKPNLTVLTGGYRRTPVMQIGADIYCDSQCIIAELEQRQPVPSLFPASDAGLMQILGRWADGWFFDLSVKLVLGAAGDNLPKDFAEDRGRLYLGADWAEGLRQAHAELPHLAAQMRSALTWLEARLADGRPYLLGDDPAAIDAQIYHVIWFVRGRWDRGPAFLDEFTHLNGWEERLRGFGHGTVQAMEPEAAIARAAQSTPTAINRINACDPRDPQGLQPGMAVSVSPDVDGGEQPVEGLVAAAGAERISLGRSSPGTGDVHVHFPRAGYVVTLI